MALLITNLEGLPMRRLFPVVVSLLAACGREVPADEVAQSEGALLGHERFDKANPPDPTLRFAGANNRARLGVALGVAPFDCSNLAAMPKAFSDPRGDVTSSHADILGTVAALTK